MLLFRCSINSYFSSRPAHNLSHANGPGEKTRRTLTPRHRIKAFPPLALFLQTFTLSTPPPTPAAHQKTVLSPAPTPLRAGCLSLFPYVGLRPAWGSLETRSREFNRSCIYNKRSTIINFHRRYRDFSSEFRGPLLQLSFSFPSFLIPGPSIFRFIIVNLLPNSLLRRDINERSHVPFDEQLINAKIPRFDTETSLKFNKYVSF